MARLLVQLGSLMAGIAIIWAVYVATQDLVIDEDVWRRSSAKVMATKGPLELAGVGVLLWLIGRWRGSTRKF
jgi:hypothetical protein